METKVQRQPKKKLGLDDPRRVRKISDRGHGLRQQHAYYDKSVDVTTADAPDTCDFSSIIYELESELVTYGLDGEKFFLPYDKLREILPLGRVWGLVKKLNCFSKTTDQKSMAMNIYHGSNQHPPCLKLLAALICVGLQENIIKFMEDSINDSCFPLRLRRIKARRQVCCNLHQDSHTAINELLLPSLLEIFSTWSYRLSTPFILKGGKVHSHYILDSGDILPVPSVHGNPHIGGFSTVHKIELQRGHFAAEEQRMPHPGRFYALKKLLPSEDGPDEMRESFNMELSSLLFSQDNASEAGKHLLQVIATFEVVSPDPRDFTWYFLFDWAEGNLCDFWKRNTSLVQTPRILPWVAAQFYGLCLALQGVHNERVETAKGFKLEENPGEALFGRHGDINPSNFLWFRSADASTPGTLTFADFGLGRLHRQVSRSAQQASSTGRTATYRAPEFDLQDNAVISRKADIFSLGCVFLEYVTWFLLGYEEIEAFSEARMEPDIHQFTADTFFSVNKAEGSNEYPFTIKKSVCNLVDDLKGRDDCCLYLQDFLDIIITDMLQPVYTKRIDIAQLKEKMHGLSEKCKTDSNYWKFRGQSPA